MSCHVMLPALSPVRLISRDAGDLARVQRREQASRSKGRKGQPKQWAAEVSLEPEMDDDDIIARCWSHWPVLAVVFL